MNRRRVVGMIVAAVLATLGTLMLVLYVQGAKNDAVAGERVVDVVVVTKTIPMGSTTEQVSDRVRVEQVPAKVRADEALTALTQLEDVKGQVTTAELHPGEQLIRSRFGFTGVVKGVRLAAPAGKLEVTVAVDPERALGGTIAAGNTVAVLASFDPFDVSAAPNPQFGNEKVTQVDGMVIPDGGKTPNSTHLILHKVLVTNVQVETDSSSSSTDKDKNATDAPKGKLLVTLALDAPSVERIVFAAEHGHVWLANEPKDAPEEGTKIQTRGSVNQ